MRRFFIVTYITIRKRNFVR